MDTIERPVIGISEKQMEGFSSASSPSVSMKEYNKQAKYGRGAVSINNNNAQSINDTNAFLQSGGDIAFNVLTQTATEFIGGTIGTFGGWKNLLDVVRDTSDYSRNWLEDIGNDITESGREIAPIFMTKAQQSGEDFGMVNIASLIPSVVGSMLSMMIPSGIAGKAIGILGKLAARGIISGLGRASKMATMLSKGAAASNWIANSLVPATFSRHADSRRESASTYLTSYQDYVQRHGYTTDGKVSNNTRTTDRKADFKTISKEADEYATEIAHSAYRNSLKNIGFDIIEWTVLGKAASRLSRAERQGMQASKGLDKFAAAAVTSNTKTVKGALFLKARDMLMTSIPEAMDEVSMDVFTDEAIHRTNKKYGFLSEADKHSNFIQRMQVRANDHEYHMSALGGFLGGAVMGSVGPSLLDKLNPNTKKQERENAANMVEQLNGLQQMVYSVDDLVDQGKHVEAQQMLNEGIVNILANTHAHGNTHHIKELISNMISSARNIQELKGKAEELLTEDEKSALEHAPKHLDDFIESMTMIGDQLELIAPIFEKAQSRIDALSTKKTRPVVAAQEMTLARLEASKQILIKQKEELLKKQTLTDSTESQVKKAVTNRFGEASEGNVNGVKGEAYINDSLENSFDEIRKEELQSEITATDSLISDLEAKLVSLKAKKQTELVKVNVRAVEDTIALNKYKNEVNSKSITGFNEKIEGRKKRMSDSIFSTDAAEDANIKEGLAKDVQMINNSPTRGIYVQYVDAHIQKLERDKRAYEGKEGYKLLESEIELRRVKENESNNKLANESLSLFTTEDQFTNDARKKFITEFGEDKASLYDAKESSIKAIAKESRRAAEAKAASNDTGQTETPTSNTTEVTDVESTDAHDATGDNKDGKPKPPVNTDTEDTVDEAETQEALSSLNDLVMAELNKPETDKTDTVINVIDRLISESDSEVKTKLLNALKDKYNKLDAQLQKEGSYFHQNVAMMIQDRVSASLRKLDAKGKIIMQTIEPLVEELAVISGDTDVDLTVYRRHLFNFYSKLIAGLNAEGVAIPEALAKLTTDVAITDFINKLVKGAIKDNSSVLTAFRKIDKALESDTPIFYKVGKDAFRIIELDKYRGTIKIQGFDESILFTPSKVISGKKAKTLQAKSISPTGSVEATTSEQDATPKHAETTISEVLDKLRERSKAVGEPNAEAYPVTETDESGNVVTKWVKRMHTLWGNRNKPITDDSTDAERKADANMQAGAKAGNILDKAVRDFFTGVDTSSNSYITDLIKGGMTHESIRILNAHLNVLAAEFERNGETVLTEEFRLIDKDADYGGGIIGTTDIITYDKDNNFRIYDIKNVRGLIQNGKMPENYNKEFNGKSSSYVTHSEQLEAYGRLFRNATGVQPVGLYIIPFASTYESASTRNNEGGNDVTIKDVKFQIFKANDDTRLSKRSLYFIDAKATNRWENEIPINPDNEARIPRKSQTEQIIEKERETDIKIPQEQLDELSSQLDDALTELEGIEIPPIKLATVIDSLAELNEYIANEGDMTLETIDAMIRYWLVQKVLGDVRPTYTNGRIDNMPEREANIYNLIVHTLKYSLKDGSLDFSFNDQHTYEAIQEMYDRYSTYKGYEDNATWTQLMTSLKDNVIKEKQLLDGKSAQRLTPMSNEQSVSEINKLLNLPSLTDSADAEAWMKTNYDLIMAVYMKLNNKHGRVFTSVTIYDLWNALRDSSNDNAYLREHAKALWEALPLVKKMCLETGKLYLKKAVSTNSKSDLAKAREYMAIAERLNTKYISIKVNTENGEIVANQEFNDTFVDKFLEMNPKIFRSKLTGTGYMSEVKVSDEIADKATKGNTYISPSKLGMYALLDRVRTGTQVSLVEDPNTGVISIMLDDNVIGEVGDEAMSKNGVVYSYKKKNDRHYFRDMGDAKNPRYTASKFKTISIKGNQNLLYQYLTHYNIINERRNDVNSTLVESSKTKLKELIKEIRNHPGLLTEIAELLYGGLESYVILEELEKTKLDNTFEAVDYSVGNADGTTTKHKAHITEKSLYEITNLLFGDIEISPYSEQVIHETPEMFAKSFRDSLRKIKVNFKRNQDIRKMMKEKENFVIDKPTGATHITVGYEHYTSEDSSLKVYIPSNLISLKQLRSFTHEINERNSLAKTIKPIPFKDGTSRIVIVKMTDGIAYDISTGNRFVDERFTEPPGKNGLYVITYQNAGRLSYFNVEQNTIAGSYSDKVKPGESTSDRAKMTDLLNNAVNSLLNVEGDSSETILENQNNILKTIENIIIVSQEASAKGGNLYFKTDTETGTDVSNRKFKKSYVAYNCKFPNAQVYYKIVKKEYSDGEVSYTAIKSINKEDCLNWKGETTDSAYSREDMFDLNDKDALNTFINDTIQYTLRQTNYAENNNNLADIKGESFTDPITNKTYTSKTAVDYLMDTNAIYSDLGAITTTDENGNEVVVSNVNIGGYVGMKFNIKVEGASSSERFSFDVNDVIEGSETSSDVFDLLKKVQALLNDNSSNEGVRPIFIGHDKYGYNTDGTVDTDTVANFSVRNDKHNKIDYWLEEAEKQRQRHIAVPIVGLIDNRYKIDIFNMHEELRRGKANGLYIVHEMLHSYMTKKLNTKRTDSLDVAKAKGKKIKEYNAEIEAWFNELKSVITDTHNRLQTKLDKGEPLTVEELSLLNKLKNKDSQGFPTELSNYIKALNSEMALVKKLIAEKEAATSDEMYVALNGMDALQEAIAYAMSNVDIYSLLNQLGTAKGESYNIAFDKNSFWGKLVNIVTKFFSSLVSDFTPEVNQASMLAKLEDIMNRTYHNTVSEVTVISDQEISVIKEKLESSVESPIEPGRGDDSGLQGADNNSIEDDVVKPDGDLELLDDLDINMDEIGGQIDLSTEDVINIVEQNSSNTSDDNKIDC